MDRKRAQALLKNIDIVKAFAEGQTIEGRARRQATSMIHRKSHSEDASMTTETSNARGPEYTTEMGDAADRYIRGICVMADGTYAIRPQSFPGTFRWEDLYHAMLAAAPPPAAARGDVRGVVDALQRAAESVHVPPKMTETRGEYFKAGARAMLTAMNRELAALTGERNG